MQQVQQLSQIILSNIDNAERKLVSKTLFLMLNIAKYTYLFIAHLLFRLKIVEFLTPNTSKKSKTLYLYQIGLCRPLKKPFDSLIFSRAFLLRNNLFCPFKSFFSFLIITTATLGSSAFLTASFSSVSSASLCLQVNPEFHLLYYQVVFLAYCYFPKLR